ncbi:hypothetical protein [Tenacibaculum geojense]|uniref:Uncharacterized protein n=1 Tax=Tenacibaculum geojense TaxID=915352 RepID=A0ABW3JTT8_9FLAO
MKKLFLLAAILLTYSSFAQSTDLDREYFNVSFVKLPSKPILENDKRTYSLNLNGVTIKGFTKVNKPGTLDLDYKFTGTTSSEVKIEKIKHEKKDDDGNVISTSYTYQAKSKFTSSATLNVINSFNNNSYEQSFQESTDYKSSEFNSYYKAERHYANNKYEIKNNYRNQHRKNIKNRVRNFLNDKYGYQPYKGRDFLWILGSKRHPEHAKHHEAFNNMKEIFSKMKFDKPMTEIEAALAPVITYFEEVIPRYPGTKRKMRKVKYASYYNLANIYYFLDKPEKVKEYGQKIIDNGYDKSDGKKFIRYGDNLANILATNKMTSRHMEIITEDNSNEVSEAPEVAEEPKEKPLLELNKAFLITQKNDTLQVDVETKNIASIGYDVKTVVFDTNGTPVGTRTKKAEGCKEILFVDGLHYKTINFNEASKNSVSIGGGSGKLCKVLFESDKINLYQFNNKELIIVTPGAKNGKSTSSAGFVFGFNKRLKKMAENCPAVIEKVNAKTYKNTSESLLQYCKDLTSCSK